MTMDKNEFFRQATLKICSSLDIEKAISGLLQYIRLFMPAFKASLDLFEPNAGTLRSLVVADHKGEIRSYPHTQLPREAIQELESYRSASGIRISNWDENNALVKFLRPYIDLANHSLLSMDLVVEGKRLGFFSVWAESRAMFTQEHISLISLLKEPFSIALSNALRHEEVVKLKDILDAENRELRQELSWGPASEIIGTEYGLKGTMEMVRQVAPLNTPVLLLGETGVGKEVIANAIHHTSSRNSGPFVKVNCGAIPDTLVDSELFGHERGAFTGAIAQKRGRFERAERGTIFLDEIGELPPPAQVRLLRVLQHKEIERVGGTKTISVDVRIIAATHRDMRKLVQTGAFREDLWFRLNVFPITIPPLRHRKEDIPALVHHFIEKKSKDLKIYPPPSVFSEDIERLKAYSWPGNIRELENLVERELIYLRGKGKSERLTFNHFENFENTGIPGIAEEGDQNMLTLDETMSMKIRQALQTADGRIGGPKGAAKLLGINANTLRGRMKKLGIPFKYS